MFVKKIINSFIIVSFRWPCLSLSVLSTGKKEHFFNAENIKKERELFLIGSYLANFLWNLSLTAI